MVSVESILDQLVRRIQEVEHNISIGFVTSCEYDDLVVFIRLLQTLNGIGTDINACLHRVSVRECYINYLVTGVAFDVIDAVD